MELGHAFSELGAFVPFEYLDEGTQNQDRILFL